MKKKKNIVILSWEMYPLFLGGLGILVRDIVDELKKQNVNVTVLLPYTPKGMDLEDGLSLEKSTKKYYRLKKTIPDFNFDLDYFRPLGRKPGESWPQMFEKSAAKKKGQMFKCYPNNTPGLTRAFAFAVLDYLKDNPDIDAVIGADWETIPTKVLLDRVDYKIPFFFHVNSTEVDRSPKLKSYTPAQKAIFQLEKEYLKTADKVMVVSSVTKESLIQNCEVDKKNILVISNDLTFEPDTDGYRDLHTGKNILYIGRIAPQKGLTFLLDTAEKMVSIDSSVRFLIAGDGSMVPEMVKSICERKLEKNCFVVGFVNNVEKKQLYKSGDIFVMPSPSEPFGLTAFEAIKSDVPVVASEKCGFIDVIPSTPIFEYYDTNKFAEILMHYLNDKEDREKLLLQQKKELSKHKWSDQIAKIINEL